MIWKRENTTTYAWMVVGILWIVSLLNYLDVFIFGFYRFPFPRLAFMTVTVNAGIRINFILIINVRKQSIGILPDLDILQQF